MEFSLRVLNNLDTPQQSCPQRAKGEGQRALPAFGYLTLLYCMWPDRTLLLLGSQEVGVEGLDSLLQNSLLRPSSPRHSCDVLLNLAPAGLTTVRSNPASRPT